MGDLGSIADNPFTLLGYSKQAVGPQPGFRELVPAWTGNPLFGSVQSSGQLRNIRLFGAAEDLLAYVVRNNTEGSPASPCLEMRSNNVMRFRWAVAAGDRTISISVKQAANLTPRPKLVVKANTSIGVNADVSGTAGAGTGWVTIGPVTISPSSDGAVWFELQNLLVGWYDCFWDNLSTT